MRSDEPRALSLIIPPFDAAKRKGSARNGTNLRRIWDDILLVLLLVIIIFPDSNALIISD